MWSISDKEVVLYYAKGVDGGMCIARFMPLSAI